MSTLQLNLVDSWKTREFWVSANEKYNVQNINTPDAAATMPVWQSQWMENKICIYKQNVAPNCTKI